MPPTAALFDSEHVPIRMALAPFVPLLRRPSSVPKLSSSQNGCRELCSEVEAPTRQLPIVAKPSDPFRSPRNCARTMLSVNVNKRTAHDTLSTCDSSCQGYDVAGYATTPPDVMPTSWPRSSEHQEHTRVIKLPTSSSPQSRRWTRHSTVS